MAGDQYAVLWKLRWRKPVKLFEECIRREWTATALMHHDWPAHAGLAEDRLYVSVQYLRQEAQLLQRGRAMPRVVEYFG